MRGGDIYARGAYCHVRGHWFGPVYSWLGRYFHTCMTCGARCETRVSGEERDE